MTAETNQTPLDLLEQATAALRDSAPMSSPSPALIESTVAALELLETAPVVVVRPEARNSRSRFIRYSGLAAAAAAIVLAGVLWFVDRTATLTFAQVVENIRNARSVNFVTTTKPRSKPRTYGFGGRSELEAKTAIQGDRVRYELPGAVIIFDTKERKALELHSVDKVAEKGGFYGPEEKLPADVFQNPVERLRNLKDEIKDNVEQLADETVDGRKCQVYQIKNRLKSPATWLVPDRFKLWVDVKTCLPVRIEATDENQSITYDHFVWDQPLDEKLFSLEVPQGYRLRELAPAVISADRIYVGRPSLEIKSMRPDGSDEQMQFLPRLGMLPDSYVSDKTEISPNGRYLVVAFNKTTDHGSFPPDRIYLWDRTRATANADMVYSRPGSELNSWQFSADGRQLYVQWWQPLHEQTRPEGRLGAEVVDLKDKTTHELKLPTFKDAAGAEQTMRFMAASGDGHTFFVVGNGLQIANENGEIVRRLSAPTAPAIVVGSVHVSPDDKQVLFVTVASDDQSQDLWIMSVAGGVPKPLLPSRRFTNVRARWSPDGKRIAYTCRLLDPKNPPFNYGTETSLVTVGADGDRAVTVLNEKVDRMWGPTLELIGWR